MLSNGCLAAGNGLDPRRGVPSALHGVLGPGAGLFVVDAATGVVTQLTPDSLSVQGTSHRFSWSPDERALAVSVTHEGHGLGDIDTDLIVVSRERPAVRPLVTQPGGDMAPYWSPDGRWIAYCSNQGEISYDPCRRATLVPAAGGAPHFFDENDADITRRVFMYPGSFWRPDGSAFVYVSRMDMTQRLVRGDVSDRTTTVVPAPAGDLMLPHDGHYGNYSISRDGRRLAYTRESLTTPPDLFVVALDDRGHPVGTPRQLTRLTPDFPLGRLVETDTLSWPSPDGKFLIHGLLLTPAGTAAAVGHTNRSAHPLPTLVFFRGGPSMVERSFAGEGFKGALLALAARGYAVLVPNTRGRDGYGEAFQRGLRDGRSTGRLPYEDAMAGVDLLIRRGLADSTQLGVLGHSWGGYWTAFTITQTPRFKGAVVHESVDLDLLTDGLRAVPGSFYYYMLNELGIGSAFDSAERAKLMAESPALNADRITTPTLLQFGKSDPLLFLSALRLNHVPSALFVYDEGHLFQRPAAVADDLTRTAEWLDYWVRGIPFPDAERAKEYNAWRGDKAEVLP